MIQQRFTQAYFVGIGGIGMSALAHYLHHRGLKVAGYDKNSERHHPDAQRYGDQLADELATLPNRSGRQQPTIS